MQQENKEAQRLQWIKQLYEQYKNDVFRLCLTILNDIFLAEDAMQETFFKAQRKGDTYVGGESEKAWLLKIARNTSYDYLRKRKHEFLLEKENVEQLLDGSRQEIDISQLEYINMIACLKEKDRDIICLRIIGELSHKEIAEIMKMTVHSVKKRYERAIRKLRLNYEEE